MDPMELFRSVATCAQILLAAILFASKLPLRQPVAIRITVVAAVFAGWSVLLAAIMPNSMPGSGSEALVMLTYGITLAVCLSLIAFLFETSIWTALFCCTAGYTLQNLGSSVGALLMSLSFPADAATAGLLSQMVAPFALVYLVAYAVLVSRIHKNGLDMIESHVMLPMMAVVILAVIGFDVVIKELRASGAGASIVVSLRLVHIMLCILVLAFEYEVLYGKRMHEEAITIERIMTDEKEQFQISRDTIDAINIKCHDIKHQIRQLGVTRSVDPEVLEEIERKVDVYDSAIRTGNDALDVILTEKSLLCGQEGICLGCIADGTALEMMPPSDIYSLIGNALDNAIDAARAVADPQRRSISLMLRRRGSMAILHVENYFAGTVRLNGDGIAETTKADRSAHGYGMKSMRLIAERYGGFLHARTQGDVFHLNIAIPLAGGPDVKN